MASIGSLGRKKPAIELDFDYFGESIRVNPHASNLVEIDFLRVASGIDLDDIALDAELTDEDIAKLPPQTQARIAKAGLSNVDIIIASVRKLIHADDWDRFWATAIANGQDLEDLLEVQKAVTAAVAEAVAGFPTGPSSDSSDGSASTAPRSVAAAPSPTPAPPSSSAADEALVMLRGRPDLQEFVVMHEEARAKATAS